jgi:hypothetical protein
MSLKYFKIQYYCPNIKKKIATVALCGNLSEIWKPKFIRICNFRLKWSVVESVPVVATTAGRTGGRRWPAAASAATSGQWTFSEILTSEENFFKELSF